MKNTTRLLLAIFFTTFLTFVAFTAVAYYLGDKSQTTFISDRVVSVNQLKAKKINSFYATAQANVTSIMKQAEFRKNMLLLANPNTGANARTAATTAVVADLDNHYDESGLEEVLAVRTDKIIFFAHGETSSNTVGQKIPAYIDSLFSQGQLQNSSGQLFIDPEGHVSLGIGQPLLDTDGYPVGVVIMHYYFQPYIDAVAENTGLSTTGETYLVAQEDNSTILYLSPLRTNPQATLVQRITTQDVKAEASLNAVRGPAGKGFATDYAGTRVIAAWEPLVAQGWGIVTKIDAKEGLLTLARVRWSLVVLLVLLGVVLFVGISWALRFYVHRPLESLERVAKEIEHDNYAGAAIDHRLLYSSDEFGAIATALHNIIEHHKNHQHTPPDKHA